MRIYDLALPMTVQRKGQAGRRCVLSQ